MDPKRYTVEYPAGKFTTIRTCNNATGAFVSISGQRLEKWHKDPNNPRVTIVNGYCVLDLDFHG